MLTELLEKKGIKPVIVGGLSVEIYTLQAYSTHDIDLIMDGRDVADEILTCMGFIRKGREWWHPEVLVSVEIPDNVLAGDFTKVTTVPVGNRIVHVIGVEDLILDRLRAAVHWKSTADREWGFQLLQLHHDHIDLPYIRNQLSTATEKKEWDTWQQELDDGI
jgi:hypothetical protein